MRFPLVPHEQPGVLVAICGMDGSGKSTLERALVTAISSRQPCVATIAPSEWWRRDPHVSYSLFRKGPGHELPNDALLNFALADCFAHQAREIMPALSSGAAVVANRYLFDMLALIEARGLENAPWVSEAVATIVQPDLCFVLNGQAEVIVERVVQRDGPTAGRFDQDVAFVERYNASLARMATDNDHIVLSVEADLETNLERCLDALSEAGLLHNSEPGTVGARI